MHTEHRKQRIIRLLQAVENEARHMGKKVEEDDFSGQFECLFRLVEHIETVRRLCVRNYAETLFSVTARTEDVEEAVEQLMNCLIRLKSL
ncbi:MAG: hypothetical protein RMK18_05865 [Armatimonadota bacterium]|nr:hypothetical protein [Armatimonadota bacterium]MCX7777358.1 hypothetical protein [Armatimonadota bacterium]MDW8025374.1 hypothetical protein [Armatimonadota bacterium]